MWGLAMRSDTLIRPDHRLPFHLLVCLHDEEGMEQGGDAKARESASSEDLRPDSMWSIGDWQITAGAFGGIKNQLRQISVVAPNSSTYIASKMPTMLLDYDYLQDADGIVKCILLSWPACGMVVIVVIIIIIIIIMCD